MRKLTLTLLPLLVAVPLCAQKKPATKPKPPVAAKPAPLIPLKPQERAQQLLNRFTFGPRPGDIEASARHHPRKMVRTAAQPSQHP